MILLTSWVFTDAAVTIIEREIIPPKKIDTKLSILAVFSFLIESHFLVTKDECKKAYPLLVRKFGRKQTRHPYKDEWVKRKMGIRKVRPMGKKTYETHVRKCWICLSGNPNGLSKGWRRLIHDVSHMVHKWLRPNMNHHCYQQAELELDMIKYVQSKGWLNGTLKKKKIVISPEDKKLKKIKHVEALVKKWETKNKTTLTYLKKYKAKLKRLNK